MQTYVALLRGINVSGKNKVPMAELKELFSSLGFQRISTYIQSGNVVFEAGAGVASELTQQLETAIKSRLGFDVSVVIRTGAELQNTIATNPYQDAAGAPDGSAYITFLAEQPKAEQLTKLYSYAYPPDEFSVVGKEVYVRCPGGYGNTKLSNNFFESKLKVKATTRNWKTVLQLAEMAG